MLEAAPVSQHGKCCLRDPRSVTPPQFRMGPKELAQKHIGWPNTGQQPAHRIFEQPEPNATGHTRAVYPAPDHTARRPSAPRNTLCAHPRTNPRPRYGSPLQRRPP
jgi:hypothetical protein